MQIEFLVNGGVSLLMAPENEMEEALLKQMMKQDNDIIEIRTSVQVLAKTFRNGILLGKKSVGNTADKKAEEAHDKSKEEKV